MTPWYLDTSVALHAVLPDGDPAAIAWLEAVRRRHEPIVSATLLRLEVIRALRRDKQPLHLADALFARVDFIKLQEGILVHAARIEPHVRSLGAIHLSTAVLSGLVPTVVTHDGTMATLAQHLGLEAVDPLLDT